jgi:hypothetical protein
MMSDNEDSDNTYPKMDEDILHSAAIIDANGREITITKEMIDLACDQLATQIDQFQHHKPSEQ